MRFRLEFDVPDKDAGMLRSLIEKPIFSGVQVRSGLLYTEISNCELTQLTQDSQAAASCVGFQRAVIATLHDLSVRYGCGGTSDHELVSDVLQAIETGIQQRLNGEVT